MCTCITLKQHGFYFGRNLDLEYNFGEKVVITPRNYPFNFLHEKSTNNHFAMIGMATVFDNYPLYAEACNEKSLCIAGLYFPNNAHFSEKVIDGKINLSPYELIPWVLSNFSSVEEVLPKLNNMNLINVPFNDKLPLAPQHYMISDKDKSVVIESTKDGVKIYDNPYEVLTNNPPFNFHLENVRQYLTLSPNYPKDTLSKDGNLTPFGQGFGAIGLPGDLSPASRFVRAYFLKENSHCENDENSCVGQFFHVLDGVSMTRGATITPEGKYDITTYSCCINALTQTYYYKTYDNNQINALKMNNTNLDSNELFIHELILNQSINYIN